MRQTYVALLRGVNVGGNTMIKMSELKSCMEKLGFEEVKNYIQSGNIIFKTSEINTRTLAEKIQETTKKTFKFDVPVLVLSQKEMERIIKNTPDGWGEDPAWKYNLLFLLPPYDIDKIVESIGELKADLETLTPGAGVLYQTISIELFGRTTTGKLASNPIYKQMTVRNHRSAAKILELMKN